MHIGYWALPWIARLTARAFSTHYSLEAHFFMVNSNDGIKIEASIITIWILGYPECLRSVANRFKITKSIYFVFIAEFVERLPTIFQFNIWSTYKFEIEHRWAKWLISDPSPKGTRWISDPVIQWSVFRSHRLVIRWILVQSGFDRSLIRKWICSPQVRNPDPDSPKGTHP